ncbi:MAG TPA: restriction endonuclease subunit S [Blastocatellia bacterium]|nr:restriction endonuclease subunit S [Blastocatellia bacterium]
MPAPILKFTRFCRSFTLNQHIFRIVFDEQLLDKFFFRLAINHRLAELIDKAHGGVGLAHVTKGKFENTRILLPPLQEQRRIVEKLDRLMTRSGRAREEVKRIPKLVERYKQAVLAAAFSGQLTEDWRESNEGKVEAATSLLERIEKARGRIIAKSSSPVRRPDGASELPNIPDSWQWVTIEQLSTKVTDGVHKKPSYVEAGIPFLTVKNLTAGPGISFETTKFVSLTDHKEFTKRTKPEKGDVLVTKDGTLGVVRVIETDIEFSIFVSLALIKPVYPEMAKFIAAMLTAPQGQEGMKATGTGLQHIHLVDLRATIIPLPPLAEQFEIVRRIEERFVAIDAAAQQTQRSADLLDHLNRETLAKAFRGELVPQDPNDEPASVMLMRIQNARKEEKTQGKRGHSQGKNGQSLFE